ncbi:MAG: B12-binding domain-containing radical SAM protein [Nitrospirota bacterium]|nr:B12-binding domain-containing radical SAM protein [Nitrospirota bacterium]
MKVLFAYPPTGLINREDRCQVPTGKVPIAPTLPPTDLLYMAASAEAAGAECQVLDCPASRLDMAAFTAILREYKPDLLVLSTTTPTLLADLTVCREAKKALPGLTIIAKGAHFLVFDREVLRAHPEVDILLRSEPEPLIKRIVSGESLETVHGITWRRGEEVLRNDDAPFQSDLDALAFPARHLIDNRRYVRPDKGRPQGIIKCSRGCPYNCFFCLATPVSGRKVRMRSPENILDEVRHCLRTYGIEDFIFWSDVFNFDDGWVRRLCQAIRASGLRFTWASNMRADNINQGTLTLMKEAGCSLISLGIESGSQEILDKIGKKVSVEQIRDSVRLIRGTGIASFAYYMTGLPWETTGTAEQTMRLARDLRTDFANFFVATPFPGTAFFRYAVENGLFGTKDPADSCLFEYAYGSAVVKGHTLTRQEIDGLHHKAVRKYYLRPGYILNRLSKVRSMNELAAYARAAVSLGTSR